MDLVTIYLISFLSLWLFIVTFFFVKLYLHYQRLTQGVAKKNLIASLNQLIAQAKLNQDETRTLQEKLTKEIKANRLHLQKIGFARFNPFTDTGGNQSFSLCLLDENGSGIVISSLHSRESTRLYAKQISKGKPTNGDLSSEEKEVIKQAINQ